MHELSITARFAGGTGAHFSLPIRRFNTGHGGTENRFSKTRASLRLCVPDQMKGLSLQPWLRRSMSVCCTDTLRAMRGGQPMETDQYIGIDLHKAFFQVAAMTCTGERTWEGKYPRTPDGVQAFRARCSPQSAIAVEATTPTWSFVDQIVGAVGTIC